MLKPPRTLDAGPIFDVEPTPSLRWGPGAPAASPAWEGFEAPLVEGPDLDEELALHEEIKRRRTDPPDLDPAIEAILHRQLDATTHDDMT